MERFKEIKGKSIYTYNNWITIQKEKAPSQIYVDEKNADITDIVLLRIKYGDEKANLIRKEFLLIRNLLENKLGTFNLDGSGFGREFEVFAISVLYNMDYETVIDHHIVHGSDDGTIDAIVWDTKCVYVFQIKMGTIKSGEKNKMGKNIFEFMQDPEIKSLSSSNTKDLLKFLKENKSDILRKEIKLKAICTNSSGEDIKTNNIYKKYFKQILLPMDENNLEMFLPILNRKVDGKIIPNVSIIENKIHIFTINANKLKTAIISIQGISKGEKIYKLFYDNVRGSLGENKYIKKTIADEKEREYFIDYNNGITITGEVDYREGSGIFIKNPVVSNGQQTLTNLMSIEDDHLLNDIDVIILVKDTTEGLHLGQNKLKQKIAKYTNTQTTIKPIDLLSLDASIRDIQKIVYTEGEDNHDRFHKVKGYFLDIYSNGKKDYEETVKRLYNKRNIINLSDFIRLYSSIENPNYLGNWKSNISSMIDANYTSLQIIPSFDKDKALKVCQANYEYKRILEYIHGKDKNDLKSADLVFQYLIAKYDLTGIKAYKKILLINQEFYYTLPENLRPSKLIDIYKSNTVIEKIEKVMNEEANTISLSENIDNYDKIDNNYDDYLLWLQENSTEKNPIRFANVIYSFASTYSDELGINDTNLLLASTEKIEEVETKLDQYTNISVRQKKTLQISLDLYKKYLQNKL